MKKRILWILVGLAIAASIVVAFARSEASRRTIKAELEQEKLNKHEIVVAAGLEDPKDLIAWVKEHKELRVEVREVIRTVEGPVRVERVEETVYEEIEVPVEKIIEVPVERLVEIEAECELPEPEDLRKIRFQIRAKQAQLRTEAGNHVLVGVGELWKTSPPPEEMLGWSTIKFDATEFKVAQGAREARRALLVGWHSDGGPTLSYMQAWRKRWVWKIGGHYDGDVEQLANDYGSFQASDTRFEVAAGVRW